MTTGEAINVMEKYTDAGSEVVNEAHRMAIHALEHQKWIDTTIRLPEYKTNPITGNDLTYPVTCRFGNVYDVRYYEFYNGHWYDASPDIMDRYVVAWMERPEPYTYREEQN